MTVFTNGNQFGKIGFETFWENFEESNKFLGVKNYIYSAISFHSILDIETFPMAQESRQSESICKS